MQTLLCRRWWAIETPRCPLKTCSSVSRASFTSRPNTVPRSVTFICGVRTRNPLACGGTSAVSRPLRQEASPWRNNLKFSRPFDHHARTAVENDLHQPDLSRSQPGSSGAPKRGVLPVLLPLRVHDAIQHRDGFAGVALALARLTAASSPTTVPSRAAPRTPPARGATIDFERMRRARWQRQNILRRRDCDPSVSLREEIRVRGQPRMQVPPAECIRPAPQRSLRSSSFNARTCSSDAEP